MMYTNSEENAKLLMQTMGTLTGSQLERFFSDELSVPIVRYMLNGLIAKHYLIYDAEKDTYTFHASNIIKQSIRDKNIRAFWVLANAKSKNVEQIYALPLPMQYLYLSPDDVTYDVTVCDCENDAYLASLLFKRSLIGKAKDLTNHIAVVKDHEMREILKQYGFDMYCIIDPHTFVPQYFTFN